MNQIIRALLLGMALIVINGCGSAIADYAPPDRVRIEIDQPSPDPAHKKPVFTLNNANQVQQLYNTILALPPMPADIMCTMELGPHYTLTFQLPDGKTVMTAIARREGCRPVSIAGDKQDRQANQTFWSQLDQALQKATSK